MGVVGLWSLLNKIKQETYLSECSGQKLAIDLSSWLVSCAQVAKRPGGPDENTVRCRSIFFRIVDLLSLGIIPVFVMDSRRAPEPKKRKRGSVFYSLVKEYQVLLEALGVPVLQSSGEAEQMCAELNSFGIVDGCLTDDGDAFVYGAKTVFKGFIMEKQVPITHKYVMTDIDNELNLNQRDLVAFALMSGSDMCDGIQGIGEATFMKLANELHDNGITDVLSRIQSWKTDEKFNGLDQMSEELKTFPKKPHCSKCGHEDGGLHSRGLGEMLHPIHLKNFRIGGNVQEHKKNGCHVCATVVNCSEKEASAGEQSCNCPCSYHALEATVKPFQTELKIRKKASITEGFPSPEVVDEYLVIKTRDEDASNLTLRMPDFKKVCDILREQLRFTEEKTLNHLIPVVIRLYLHGLLTDIDIKPQKILKTKTKKKEKMYVVKWEPFTALEGLVKDESLYQCDIPQELFKSKFCNLAKAFDFDAQKSSKKTSVSPKRKRNQGETSKDDTGSKQCKLTNFFKVKK